jgi:hypothetical protein
LGERIETGTVTINCAVQNTNYQSVVTFSRSFTGIPKVFLTAYPQSNNLGYTALQYANVSTTGFGIYASSYLAQNVVISWIAVGV